MIEQSVLSSHALLPLTKLFMLRHAADTIIRQYGVVPWSAERDCRKCGDRQHFNHRHRGNVTVRFHRRPHLTNERTGNDYPFTYLLEFRAGSLLSFSSYRASLSQYTSYLLPAWRLQHLSFDRELRGKQRWSSTNQAKQTTVCLVIHSK